jgi:hypothetical protein
MEDKHRESWRVLPCTTGERAVWMWRDADTGECGCWAQRVVAWLFDPMLGKEGTFGPELHAMIWTDERDFAMRVCDVYRDRDNVMLVAVVERDETPTWGQFEFTALRLARRLEGHGNG